jgi:hypothetical protein
VTGGGGGSPFPSLPLRQMHTNFLLLLALAGLVALAAAKQVTISNVIPRRDADGAILDAHDSKLNFFEGLYYWHAASYGNCTVRRGSAPSSLSCSAALSLSS